MEVLWCPQGGTKVKCSKVCFGSFFLMMSWRIPGDRTNVEREINLVENKESKDGHGQVMSGCGAWHAREHVLKEYWQIFVDDRLVPRDATDVQANAQPKAVFSSGEILVCSLHVGLHQMRAV